MAGPPQNVSLFGVTQATDLPTRDVRPPAYETRLAKDLEWALTEGSRHFEEKSTVHDALRRIARRLGEAGIPYAVAGGMALFSHGFRRFTEDIDILVTRDGLKQIHENLPDLGCVQPFTGSKNLRDAQLGVRIKFLVTGQYPGDGKPKPVAFPDPDAAAVERDAVKYVDLPTLVELKLASGMTSPGRMRDLADVQEAIRHLGLPADFAERLNPYVRTKYRELWEGIRRGQARYVLIWRHESIPADAEALDDLIDAMPRAASTLRAMRADGVTLDSSRGVSDGCAYLVTTEPEIAKRYGMHDEAELWDDDGP